MKLEIGEPTSNEMPKDVFKLVIEFMEGDADGYDNVEIFLAGTYKDLPADHPKIIELEKLVHAVNEAIKRDSRGRGGIDTISGFEKHYVTDNEDLALFCNNIRDKEAESLGFYVPTDTYGDFYHSFQELKCFYYDENGVEYNVSTLQTVNS